MTCDGNAARVKGGRTSLRAIGGTESWITFKESHIGFRKSCGRDTAGDEGGPNQTLVLTAAKVGLVVHVDFPIPASDSKILAHAGRELCPKLN